MKSIKEISNKSRRKRVIGKHAEKLPKPPEQVVYAGCSADNSNEAIMDQSDMLFFEDSPDSL